MGLAGCKSQATSTTAIPQPTSTATPALLPTPFSTQTPIPTPTPTTAKPTATTTPFPTVTPSARIELTKSVLIQFGSFGGDGGDDFDAYLGRDAPRLVLYTDGQLVMKKGSIRDGSTKFVETKLAPAQVCSLLERIKQAGFFNNLDSLYTSGQNQSGDGGSVIIQINGEPNKQVDIDSYALPYTVKEISATYKILANFDPAKELQPYKPSQIMLWLYKPPASTIEQSLIREWPPELVSLAEIWQDQVNPTVLVEGQLANDILQLYDYQVKFMYFQVEESIYAVIARPILPHETSRKISPWPSKSTSMEIPLTCSEHPAFLPTSTPMPTPTPLPPTGMPTLPPQLAALTGLGRIVFSSARDGDDEIYVMNNDGTNPVRLTNNLDSDTSPAWSPNQQQIAFSSNRDGNYEIYVMNADGTNQTRLTHSETNDSASDWSPDGKRIVFTSAGYTANSVIYVMNVDGTALRRLADGWGPRWSPDGNHIAFASGGHNTMDIFVMDIKSKKTTRLTNQAGFNTSPAWSPDGQEIAFSSDRDGIAEIYVMTVDGKNIRRLTRNSARDYAPDWSPDGAYIVFYAYPYKDAASSGDHKPKIFVMRADGTGLFRLTNSAEGDMSPDWSP